MQKMFEKVLKRIQVAIPYKLLCEEYLPLVLEKRVNPEIGIDGTVLDTYKITHFKETASTLKREGLRITLHAPFLDIVPGSPDKKMLSASRERIGEFLELIPVFEPPSVVFHTGYDRKRYLELEDRWLETSLETWRWIIEELRNTQTLLILENVYEKTPLFLEKTLRILDSDRVGFCLDTGHMNAFSDTSMNGWLSALGRYLKEIHVHDNDASWDDHLAIGAGNIDFDYLFNYLKENKINPTITLEAHTETWVWESLEVLTNYIS